ncbi:MAG: low-specificity L-threonine aldolase [Myxococcota bacterium]
MAIDLRSDTVTQPTPAMREAIASAEVGDDVYGEDPTVNRLQELAAHSLGKEAALFVPSGTMANQVAVRVHTKPGDLVLASQGAHLLLYESGGAAALSGVQIHTLGRDGVFDPGELRSALPPEDSHLAQVSLVAVENTHNTAGGRIFPLAALRELAAEAQANGLPLHLDGARLWNAVVASGTPASVWAEPFDTVSFCLSKGLGAPVGSLLCGSRERIGHAHRIRKMLGGGMRQAGLLAAAGLHALEHHVDRLAEDHENAARLATGLEKLGLAVDPQPETNLVLFRVEDTLGFLRETRAREVLVNPVAPGRFRAVTHLDVSRSDVEEALGRIDEALRAR